MSSRPVVITFTCPVCHVGFQIAVTDLTPSQQAAIRAGCGNKHPKMVPMNRVEDE